MHLTAHLDVDVVAVEEDDEVTVLLEVAAPTPPVQPDQPARPPATLQVVLDRSGSMGADGRLDGAKRALLSLVDRLDPTDNFGLVAFDDVVEVVVPSGPLVDKAAVRERIEMIAPGGMTNLSGGLLRGLQEARRAAGRRRATLLLVSDGHANQGVTDAGALRRFVAQEHQRGVSTSTLGYGLGYDEVLLGAIADGGAGSAHFAEDPDTAGKLIAAEVEGLLATAAQAASLRIRMLPPAASVYIEGDIPSTQLPDGAVMVELGDLLAGEVRRLLLRFAVPGMPALGLATIAELAVGYVALPTMETQTVSIPVVVNVVPGDEAAGRIPDPTVVTELAFQRAQQAKLRASDALRTGDTGAASAMLADAASALADALPSAADPAAAELSQEIANLRELADRARDDDARRSAKAAYAQWHSGSRKRGRRPTTHSDDTGTSGEEQS